MDKKVTIYYLINGFGGYDTLDEAISVAKEQSKDGFSISKVTSIEEIVYSSESEKKNESTR